MHRYEKAFSGTPHQRSVCGCCSCLSSCRDQVIVCLILQVLFPVGDTTLRIYFYSQKRAFHGYVEYPHQDVMPNPICVHENRIFLPSLKKIRLQSWLTFLPIQTHQSCLSDKCFPLDRSCYLSVNHLLSCYVLCVLFFHSVHSVPVCGLHNVQNNKSAQSFQKSNHFLYHDPLFLQRKIRCNNPNRYSALHVPHLYARCSQYQTCGHCALDCKCHFFRLCRYALSVSFNRHFPPFFRFSLQRKMPVLLHAGDKAFPFIFSQASLMGERQLCCQSCRFQRQAIPSMK